MDHHKWCVERVIWFSNVILGFSSKTTQIADFEKLAWTIPFERIGMVSDAPHLSPFLGRVNTLWVCVSISRSEQGSAEGC